jgi:hypothetical protein
VGAIACESARAETTRDEAKMDYDTDKVDDAVLALLHLTSWEEQGISRAWKGHDWEVLERLHNKGLIANPRSKAKSLVLTDEGAARSRELFERLFGRRS